MQIPILNGIVTDPDRPDFRSAYPLNMVPVPKSQGISNGYLRPAEGFVTLNENCPGNDRGGVVWKGSAYRIMGTKLCRVDLSGGVQILGDVGGSGYVQMDYSFESLGFASGGKLWYWDGTKLFSVTDVDAGNVIDAMFISGYWFFTDGEFLAVTDLSSPLSVNPLRYGSSEVDPDPVVAVRRIRNEAVAVNRHTIEAFRNVGGTGFPWLPIDGSQIMRGAVGRNAVCVFESALAFVGGGRDEGVSVYLGENGTSFTIASREIEQELERYDDNELAQIVLESRLVRAHKFLYLHLPDKTFVYDASASQAVEEPVWHKLQSGASPGVYRGRGFILFNNEWVVGDPSSPRYGRASEALMTHWGEPLQWEFFFTAVYNDGNPAIVNELELVALTGRVALGADPVIWTSNSKDGAAWSMERSVRVGKIGDRTKRILWLGQGMVEHWRVQRFRGTSDAFLSFARLEADIEPLDRKRRLARG